MTRKPKETMTVTMNDGEEVKIYFTSNCFGCGVSLGNYIILDYENYYLPLSKHSDYIQDNFIMTCNHEHGHQIQSRYLGWLYFILIGFVSGVCNNLWDRIAHKKWSANKRYRWYYNRYPEKSADLLGDVKRFI